MHQSFDDDPPPGGDAVDAAHARALRACRTAALSTLAPTSHEVRAQLFARFGLTWSRERMWAACRARGLVLADMPHDPPPPLLDRIRAALRPLGETP